MHDFIVRGEYDFCPNTRSEIKSLFNGGHKVVIDNMEDALLEIGNGFEWIKPFSRYDRVHEMDLVGLRGDTITAIEIKTGTNKGLNKQVNNFLFYMAENFPYVKSEVYAFNACSKKKCRVLKVYDSSLKGEPCL